MHFKRFIRNTFIILITDYYYNMLIMDVMQCEIFKRFYNIQVNLTTFMVNILYTLNYLYKKVSEGLDEKNRIDELMF